MIRKNIYFVKDISLIEIDVIYISVVTLISNNYCLYSTRLQIMHIYQMSDYILFSLQLYNIFV